MLFRSVFWAKKKKMAIQQQMFCKKLKQWLDIAVSITFDELMVIRKNGTLQKMVPQKNG